MLGAQSCLTLCDPIYCRMPGSSVHAILQAKILEWVAIHFSRKFFWTWVSCLAGRFFTIWATREVLYCLMRMLLTQLCPILCNLWIVVRQGPGFSGHGILQARMLQWVIIPFSRGSSRPRDGTQVSHVADILFTIWTISEAKRTMTPFHVKEFSRSLDSGAPWL